MTLLYPASLEASCSRKEIWPTRITVLRLYLPTKDLPHCFLNPLLGLYSSEHEISGASYFWLIVSERALDRQLQDI